MHRLFKVIRTFYRTFKPMSMQLRTCVNIWTIYCNTLHMLGKFSPNQLQEIEVWERFCPMKTSYIPTISTLHTIHFIVICRRANNFFPEVSKLPCLTSIPLLAVTKLCFFYIWGVITINQLYVMCDELKCCNCMIDNLIDRIVRWQINFSA